MKLLTTMALGFALALSSSMAWADPAPTIVGTWVLDTAKSKFGGPAPKSTTRTYVTQGDALAMTVKLTGADGKETVQSATFKTDGKEYPFSGAPGWDTISVRTAGPRAVKYTLKRGGKVVGHGTRSISADGKTLTLTTHLVNEDGSKVEDRQVYTRQ